MVWFGLVWFGLVWFGLVWFGLVGSGRVGSRSGAGFEQIIFDAFSWKYNLATLPQKMALGGAKAAAKNMQ